VLNEQCTPDGRVGNYMTTGVGNYVIVDTNADFLAKLASDL
jgi:hypothetical protein